MKRISFCAIVMACLMAGCTSPNRDLEVAAIEKIKQELSPREIISDDPDVSRLLGMYATFVAHFPDDSLAPIYLREAADINITIDEPMQAVALLDSAIALYPGFDDMGGCWFLKGYAYETAEMFDSARAAYTYFVENYPEHVQAPSTRTMLEHNLVGATQEELLNYLLEMANNSNLVQGR